MSIQNKRLKYFTDKILKENLQKGILPDSKEFIWQLNQAFRNLPEDKPSFQYRPLRNTEIANVGKLNADNQKIFDDLYILYKNMTTVHQLLNKEHQQFIVERDKLEKQIDILENKLITFIQNNNRPGLLPYAYDTFDTTDKVNLENTSGIFVDTTNNAAHIVEEKSTSRRIFPETNFNFNILPEGIDKREETITGALSDILKETTDTYWQKQVSIKENTQVTGILKADFNKKHMMNQIDLTVLTIKPFYLEVRYTPDGQNWYHLPYYEKGFTIEKTVSLQFPTIEIRAIEFSFTKSEYDDSIPQEEGYDYQYLFGVEQISFYDKSYPTQGVLESQVLTLQNLPEHYTVDTVQLEVDEWVPTGTDIQYEIALPSTTPDWQPISPINRKHPQQTQTVNFHRLNRNATQEMFFPTEFSVRQSEAEDLLRNGIPLYRLSSIQNDKHVFELPKIQMLEGSTQLFVGKSMFEVVSYPSKNMELPEIEDFQKVQDGKEVEYLPIRSIKSGDVFKNKKDSQQRQYLVRAGIYMEESKTISAPIISTEPVRLYLNGEELFQGETGFQQTIHYVFRPGWNEIVLLVNGKNATTVNGMSTSLGFNIHLLSNRIYSSSKSLEEISVFDLQYNTKIHDRTVFAKRETEKGLEILTNFGQPGLSFDLFYDYKDTYEEEKGILLRATFERENGTNVPTPILRNYRLDFS